jgi:hypothetical protein
LPKFDQQDIIQLFEILLHVFDRHFSSDIKLLRFEFAINVHFLLIDALDDIGDLRVYFVHIELIIGLCRFVLFHMPV